MKIDGMQLIDHETILGKRQSMAGVEISLYGMKSGGWREVLVSMLRIQLWVHNVR